MNSSLTWQDRKQLSTYIGYSPKDFKLIYKASRDGCSATTFHQMCDRKGPTISIGYTTNGYVFGGYASVDFDASLGNWKADHQAFLFRLRKDGNPAFMKYPAVNAQIYNASNYGPAFGNAHRLEVFFFNGGPYQHNINGCFELNGKVVIDGSGNRAFNHQNHSSNELNGGSQYYIDIEVYCVVDSPLLAVDRPWRRPPIGWLDEDLEKLKQEITDYRPPKWLKVRQANILLVGQVGAGKSSFCNSVNSVFRGYVTSKASAGSSERSLTSMYRMYEFRSSIGEKGMGFRLCDTMGLEEDNSLDSINFPYLLDGNVKDRYQFNPSVPITPSSPDFNAGPTLKDKIHVVGFVVDGCTAGVMSKVMLDKIKAMRVLVNQRGIPMMILMTKIDLIDANVYEDICNVYRSTHILDTMEELAAKTGVPKSFITLIKNYEIETELETSVDILTMTALRQMLRLADDFFEEQMDLLNINPSAQSSEENPGVEEEEEAGRVPPTPSLGLDPAIAANLNKKQGRNAQKTSPAKPKNIL